MRHILALDAGTGSGRAVLFDENGRQLAAASREWTHKEEPGFPGSMTFERDRNWEMIASAIREVLGQVPGANVAAISTTSMREGIALYDEAGEELWACANVDARAVGRGSRVASPGPGPRALGLPPLRADLRPGRGAAPAVARAPPTRDI